MTLSIITRGTSPRALHALSLVAFACALACTHSALADVKWGRASTPIEGNPPVAGGKITLGFPDGAGILNPEEGAKLYIDSALKPRDFSLSLDTVTYADKDGDEQDAAVPEIEAPGWVDPKTGQVIPADTNLEAFDDIYVMDGKKVWASPGPAIVSRPLNVSPAGNVKLVSKTGNPREGITNIPAEGGYTLYPVRPGLDINGIRLRYEELEGKQFPYNGFDGAYFFMVTILPPDQYDWTLEVEGTKVSDPKSGDPFVSLDPQTGSITLVKSPGGIRNYKVTAKPKTGEGPEFTHAWAVKRWFTDYSDLGIVTRGRAYAICKANGQFIPWARDMTTTIVPKEIGLGDKEAATGTGDDEFYVIPTPKDGWSNVGRTIFPDENHPDTQSTPLVNEWGQLSFAYGWDKLGYHLADLYLNVFPKGVSDTIVFDYASSVDVKDGAIYPRSVQLANSMSKSVACVDYFESEQRSSGYTPQLQIEMFVASNGDIDFSTAIPIAPAPTDGSKYPQSGNYIMPIIRETQGDVTYRVTPYYKDYMRIEFFDDVAEPPVFSIGYLGSLGSSSLASVSSSYRFRMQSNNQSSIDPTRVEIGGDQGLRMEAVIEFPESP